MNKKSGHWTNTGMAKFINDNLYNYKSDDEKSMNPFRWYRLQNGEDVSKYRETINGFPCRLILINDGSTPLNEGQNEPTPGNTKDMGIFNFNHDKDATKTLGFDNDIFPNCASYEVTANSDTSAGAFMSYKERKIFYTPNNDKSVSLPLSEFGLAVGDTFVVSSEATTPDGSKGLEYIGAKYEMTSPTPKTVIVPEGATAIRLWFQGGSWYEINGIRYVKSTDVPADHITCDQADELAYLKESFELRHPDEDDVAEDWGFMGVPKISELLAFDYYAGSVSTSTTIFSKATFNSDTICVLTEAGVNWDLWYYNESGIYEASNQGKSDGETVRLYNYPYMRIVINAPSTELKEIIINGEVYTLGERLGNVSGSYAIKEPYIKITTDIEEGTGLKALIDWVDNCTDEEFVRDFEEHFHKDYTLRYFCLVTLIGAVDNLGGQYSCRV